MFGDIGGLFDALKGISSVLITFYFYVFGDPVHSYLLKALFLKNPDSAERNKITASSSTNDKLAFLNMRTPFILPRVFFDCMRNRRGKNA